MVHADEPLAVFPREGSGKFEVKGGDQRAPDFEDFGSGLMFGFVVLHVGIFAHSANRTSLFSHFLRFIFRDRHNSLKQSEQDVAAIPKGLAELSRYRRGSGAS